MSGGRGVPFVARVLLRLGPPGTRARALADVEDGADRVTARRGRSAAVRYCVREAAAIVAWRWLDGARALGERRASAEDGYRRRPIMLDSVVQDVRFGARALRRRPGFTALTLLVLALGIGSVASILTIANALFHAAPPGVSEPDRLVRVFRSWAPGEGGSVGYPDFLEYRAGARSLSGLAAYSGSNYVVTAALGEERARAEVRAVSDGFFEVLGLRPERGRFFAAAENRTPDTHPVAVVSWGFWQGRLGGGEVIGRDLLLNGHRFTIVGVAPRAFRGLSPAESPPDVYVPILMRNALAPSSDTAWRERLPDSIERWLVVVGRLRPDARIETARAELEAVSARVRATFATAPQDETVHVTDRFRWGTSTDRSLGELTRLLLAAVLVVLAVAVANVSILLLARASTRSREIGVRATLGASRGRVARQLLAESLLLACAGGAGGVLLSLWMTRVTSALLPVRLDPVPTPDGRVLALSLALTVAVALLVGAVPALRATRGDVFGAVVGRARRSHGGRLRDTLVVIQLALSLVLVTGAALFARSFAAVRSLDLGYDAEGVLAVGVNLRNHGYDVERGRVFIAEALARLAAVPGVAAVATTRQVPFDGEWTSNLEPPPGASPTAGSEWIENVGRNSVAGRYFEMLRLPLVAGRPIDARDHAGAQPVAVVNETFARTVFPDGAALGRSLPLGDDVSFAIVGVVADATYYELGETPRMQVYTSALQFYASSVTFLVRSDRAPQDLVKPVQDALLGLDRNLAFAKVRPLAAAADEQIAPFRAAAHVVGLSGLIALLLASAGLYGVMSFRVSERTREIGVRMALGATRPGVARVILTRGLTLAAAGIALGFLGALAAERLVAGLLFAIQPRDAMTLVVAPLVLVAVAVIALLVPARRAMAIDPVRAMRAD